MRLPHFLSLISRPLALPLRSGLRVVAVRVSVDSLGVYATYVPHLSSSLFLSIKFQCSERAVWEHDPEHSLTGAHYSDTQMVGRTDGRLMQ